ncbi:restriction endonuclease subunit S [Enterococcus hirae]
MSNDTLPEIRFPGFTDDWEQRKLGEIVQITMGQSPNSENYTENPEDYILVQGNADMKNNRVVPRVWTTQITKQAEKGDLILSVRAPVGDIGKTDYDVVLGRGVAAIKGNDFIFQQLGKMKESGYWNRFSTGSTFESINSNDIREALITIPTGEEQQKIGNFFKQLDDTITLHQRKLDLLKETKKGFLQKMFPKNGAKVPEIRFPGFTEDWEQRKLGEVVESFEYGLNASAKKFDGSNKYIRITDIDDINHKFNQSGVTSPDIDFANADNYKLKKGDILFARTGASVGKTYMYRESDGLVYYAGFLIRARIKSKISSEFVFQTTFTDSYNQFIKITSQRSGQPGVNAEEYSNFKIMIPNYEEQDAIGCFFKKVDDTLALHQRKLDLLKETKKGFLQKMFV